MTDTDSRAETETGENPIALAVFMPKTDENGRVLSETEQRSHKVTVHFNPESLDITFTNSVQKGRRNQPAQVSVTETSAKLSMELIFDTTLSGIDVRTETNQVARMMDPAQQRPRRGNRNRQIPSIVIFQWGTINFEGYIDSYREKLDFFSREGVPLRAAVTLSLTQQQRNFQPNTNVDYDTNMFGNGLSPGSNPQAARSAAGSGNTPLGNLGSNKSVTDAVGDRNSGAAGNSVAARGVAAANGIENMRLPEVGELVFPDVQISDGAGLSPGAGVTAGLQSQSATARQFANLKRTVNASAGAGVSLNLESHFDANQGLDINASLGLAGGMNSGDASSMSADVGVSADIELGVTFED